MKRQSIFLLVILTSTTISSADLTPSYYTCEGTLYNISVSPSGSPDLLTQQGFKVGDNLSFTIMIDFSRAGEYTLNNGTVMPYTEGIFNFYAELIDAPQVKPINGGYYNGPLDRAKLNYGWVIDNGDGTYFSAVYVGTGNTYFGFGNYTPWPTHIKDWEAGVRCDLSVGFKTFDSLGNSTGAYVSAGEFDSIEPVPVPSAVILGILGLSTAGWRLRKKTKE